jgi:hypothetical protein
MKLIKLIFVFSLLIYCKSSEASHSMGADLTYQCLGQDVNGHWMYKLRYSFYRDCFGINPTNPMDIHYSSSCFPALQQINLTLISNSEISPTCPTAPTTCANTSNPYTGIQEWVFEGTVTLPDTCNDWTFYHSESARNAAINTIVTTGNLHVFSVINNTLGTCNSSPVFSNRPVPSVCLGQSFYYNNGAFDAEEDSLSFQLITPLTGPNPGDTVTYDAFHSRQQPVVSFPAMTFNTSTGEFQITPTQSEVSIMAILISEWRNGVLIGQVERDLQITVSNCSNFLPALSSITGLPGPAAFQSTVCANETNCFFIKSFDPDANQTTTITWDHSIPGASVTTSGTHRDTLYFCWTPSISDTSSKPHCFTATVTDDNCPYLGIQNFTYCLTVSNNPNCVPLVLEAPEIKLSNDFLKIYPQPANEYFIIEIPENGLDEDELIIQNALGEIVDRQYLNGVSNRIELPESMTSGFYFISLLVNSTEIISHRTLIVNGDKR